MAADSTKLTIELEVILRRLNQALRGLDQLHRKLTSIAAIRVAPNVASVDRAGVAAQRLTLQQQRLLVQSQELANRQERARQITERLALSQQRLSQAQERVARTAGLQADAHVRTFRAIQSSLTKAPQLDAHVRAFRALNRGIADADSHVRAFRANEAALRKAPQLDAHVRAFRAIEQNTRAANRELERLHRHNNRLQQFQQRLNSIGAAALRVGGGLRSMGASAAILVSGPLVALGTIASRSAADIDAIRNRLIATEGSLEAANQRLEQLRRLADQSIGVTRRAALDAFATLSVVGNVTEDTINRQIQAMGRLNAAFTIDDQQQFFRNLIQIFTQGFERADIKEALGRVPIFEQLLAQAFGTADRKKLRELKAAGKLTLDTFLLGIAEAVNTDPVLAGVGESIRVRFTKVIERITDALEPLGLAILGPLERIVTRVEPIVLRISEAFNHLPPGIQTAVVVVGILTAALGPVLFILGGIASGIGALATALAAIIPVLSSIGLPAIAAALGGIGLLVAQVTTVVTALALAWRANFLQIRQHVTNAFNAISAAFNRIRLIFSEFIQRVLPTLQSITRKVLAVINAAWQQYGRVIVEVVGEAFQFVTGAIETFLRLFTDFVDLVLKLIDGDWRGAWRAFARIIIRAIEGMEQAVLRAGRIMARALVLLAVALIRAGARLGSVGVQLATIFTRALAAALVAAAPTIRDAMIEMLTQAVLGIDPTTIAATLVGRLLTALRKAIAEETLPVTGPTVGVDVGFTGGIARRARRTGAAVTEEKKTDNILRRQLDRLREAQDKLEEARAEGQLAQLRSRIETQFNAAKAGLDREQTALEQSFDDRLTAIKAYLKQRAQLEEAQIDAEIQKELELTSVLFAELAARGRAAEREFQTELREIAEDTRLKGQARDAAIRTAELKKATELEKALSEFKVKNAETDARVIELEKQRKALTDQRLRFERLLTEEIAKQQVQLRADLLEEQGRTADAASLRLRAQFTETVRQLRIDTAGLGTELQAALTNVDLTVLQRRLDELPEPVRTLIELLDIGIKRAQIAEAQQLVEDLSAGLRLDEQQVQNRVLDGLISQREAQAQIVALQQRYRAVLLDVLRGELAKAEAIKDQGQIVAIRTQIAEVERLGVAIDEVGREINQRLFGDLQSGISGIFSGARRGFEGLRDAAISFGERLLDMLNDLAASSIVKQLEGLLKPDAEDTQGTIGGFLSKLFGLQPKQQTDAVAASATLQTGAVTASAALTTGATTAGATFGASVLSAGASFAATVISAAAAFAATVAASSATQTGAQLARVVGGAATGLYPAVPGGVYKFVEGGYPEAVLTTDPRHAQRQLVILRAFLRETRGLGGRIRGLATGGFSTPELSLNVPRLSLPSGDFSSMQVSSPQATSVRILNQINRGDMVRGYLRSAEGTQDILNVISENEREIGRRIGIR